MYHVCKEAKQHVVRLIFHKKLRSGWSQICDPPVLASLGLELQACAITPSLHKTLLRQNFPFGKQHSNIFLLLQMTVRLSSKYFED